MSEAAKAASPAPQQVAGSGSETILLVEDDDAVRKLAATVLSECSISVEIALIWLAASADVACSELCASRALLRMEAAVSVPTAVNVRSTSAAKDLTWLEASADAVTNVD